MRNVIKGSLVRNVIAIAMRLAIQTTEENRDGLVPVYLESQRTVLSAFDVNDSHFEDRPNASANDVTAYLDRELAAS